MRVTQHNMQLEERLRSLNQTSTSLQVLFCADAYSQIGRGVQAAIPLSLSIYKNGRPKERLREIVNGRETLGEECCRRREKDRGADRSARMCV
jgi:hypothetical protein